MTNESSPWTAVDIDPDAVVGAGVALQVFGRMNPLIFQPAWFHMHGLLDATAFEQATSEDSLTVLAPGVCRWSTASLDVNVTEESFTLSTVDERFETVLAEMATVVFDRLRHTPVSEVEFERFAHYVVDGTAAADAAQDEPDVAFAGAVDGDDTAVPAVADDERAADEVTAPPTAVVRERLAGLTLAGLWESVLPGAGVDNVSLSVSEGDGRAQVTVQPSAVAPGAVYVSATRSFAVTAPAEAPNAQASGADLLGVLAEHASAAETRTRELVAALLHAVTQG